MFLHHLRSLYSWLPFPFKEILLGMIAIYVIMTIARLVMWLWDLLPFV